MKFPGASQETIVEGFEKLPGTSNYFFGNDPEQWRTNVPMYRKVRYRALYPGVDVVYYGTGRQLEYDFIVAAGASEKPIAMAFEGADRIGLDASGDLKLRTGGQEIRLRKPVAYQI